MLARLSGIKIGDIISITGSGGKTSAMLLLSKELRTYKILITTTTKIFMPEEGAFDFYASGFDEGMAISERKDAGIYLIGKWINKEKKISSLKEQELSQLIKNFQVTIIESDGSKMKFLKGWKENEPVVVKDTTKTMGVINFKLLGQEINSDNIHRVQEYVKMSGGEQGEEVTLNQIKNLVLNKDGLFKNSYGEKILLINMIETSEDERIALEFFNLFNSKELENFDKIIVGSIIRNSFKRIF
ncbi:MAG: selenium cofactor biosynthesis protein YqeC [Clostridiaceae bacterium]